MIILCDTSSILLLLRIAPEMFVDPVFECVTIHEVVKEIVSTTKFKKKYPWRTEYRTKLIPLPASQYRTPSYERLKGIISALIESVVMNEKTQRMISLSEEDQAIAACAIANGYSITSGDTNLVAFLQQQFKPDFRGNLTALEVVNFWLAKGAITWDDSKQTLLADWKTQGEVAQPRNAIQKFTQLTKKPYLGS
jgi:hypothetical protein